LLELPRTDPAEQSRQLFLIGDEIHR
jgi:hypothetical protein